MTSLKKTVEIIKDLIAQNFWGEIVIKFKNGTPVLVTTVSQTKLN